METIKIGNQVMCRESAVKVNTSNRRLNSIVQEILVRDFPELGGAGWKCRGKIIQEDDEVTVLRVQVISQQASRAYWIKDWKDKNWDHAENEAVALSKLQKVFSSNPRLFVPRLVVWDPDGKYIATEDFKGATYRTVLLWNCMFPSKYSKLLVCTDEIVDWLRCFQASTVHKRSKIDTEELDREFSSRLSVCFEQGFLSKHMFESLSEAYKTCLVAVQDTEFKIVPVHGDFGPINILVGETGVCAVDFEVYHYGPNHVDVCYMWASLLAMSTYHVLGRACLRGLIERFLHESRFKLDLDKQGLQLELLRILLKKAYNSVRLGFKRSQQGRLGWMARAYFYRSLLARFLKGGLF